MLNDRCFVLASIGSGSMLMMNMMMMIQLKRLNTARATARFRCGIGFEPILASHRLRRTLFDYRTPISMNRTIVYVLLTHQAE